MCLITEQKSPVYDTQAEFNMRYLAGKVRIYIIGNYRLPMAEQVGCGAPCLLWSLGVRQVVGSRPGRGNSKESFSSNQETGKVFSPEIPFYSKIQKISEIRSPRGEV